MSMSALRSLVFIMLVSLLGAASSAVAQTPEPFPAPSPALWRSGVLTDPINHPTPDAACRVQWQDNNPTATYENPTPGASSNVYNCHWSGGSTVLPAATQLVCPPGGGWAIVGGFCIQANEQRTSAPCDCVTPVSGTPVPFVGNPINLQGGDKVEFARDYATADGLLAVDRFYQSGSRGRGTLSPTEIAGFGSHWHGLIPGQLVIGNPDLNNSFDIAEYLPVAGGIQQFGATNTADPASYSYAPQGLNRYRVSMVSVPSVDRAVYFRQTEDTASTGEVRLDFPNGDFILFRRWGASATQSSPPSQPLGTQRLLIPTEHHLASGYTRYFDYAGGAVTPYRIRDSFGRQMLLTWQNVIIRVPCFGGPPGSMCDGAQALNRPVISTVTLPDGTSLAYQYDTAAPTGSGGPNDRLIGMQHLASDGTTLLFGRSYIYENGTFPYALTGIRDQANQRLSSIAYDQAGLPQSTEKLATVPVGGTPAVVVDRYEVEHLRVNSGTLLRVVTNPLGLETTYRFSQSNGIGSDYLLPRNLTTMDIAATALVPARTQNWGYLSNLVDTATDGRAIVTDNNNDVQGRPTLVRDALGRPEVQTTALEWQPVRDLTESEQRGNLRIEYDYDAQGRVIERREIDVSTHTLPYPTSGQTRTWTYQWLANGRLDLMNGPRSPDGQGRDDTEDYAYDAAGNLESVTNGMGHVTRFESFDANGRPKRMYDANNVQTGFTYDALGRMTQMTVREPGGSAHAVTTFEYDIEHRIVGITRPATARLGMTYDLAGRLSDITAPTGEKIAFTYDAMGNVTRQRTTDSTNAQRADIARTFDELGRMITQTLGPGRTWSYAYDAQDNPTRTTSARNFATDQAFDGLARLIRTVHPDTGEDELGYNQNDDLTSFTDPLDVATGFTYNGFGQVIREVSPDRGTSVYEYGPGGDLTAATDGRGQRVEFTQDILGRVLTRTPVGLAGEQISYSYDSAGIAGSYGVGRLATISDASGTTHFKYDHRGNIVTRQQVIAGSPTLTLSMTYDLADRITRITYPSGRWANYARDARGRVETITMLRSGAPSVTTLMSSMAYEPFGALASATLGNGQLYKQTRDDSGRLTARRYRTDAGANLWSVAYGYDADDNITGITDLVTPARDLAFQYDGVDRLARVDLAQGPERREDYVHDLGGNRIRVERRTLPTDPTPASQDSYTRTTGTNRIASITTAAGTRTFTPDARGNLVAEDRPGTNDVTVGYDGYARLISYGRTGEANLTMAYNGMDQRVALTTGGVTRRFVYDMDGRLLGEYGPNGSQFFAEYIWQSPEVGDSGEFGGDDGMGGWAPLAVAASNGAGASQTFHWLHVSHLGVPVASYDASGNATSLTGITLLGFPGQTQTLADLYYNQYRDYDPTTGRYIQADPIGLAGDVNPYVYAGANPVGMVDPWGLAVTTPAAITACAGPQAPACVTIAVAGVAVLVTISCVTSPECVRQVREFLTYAWCRITNPPIVLSPPSEMAGPSRRERSTDYPSWVDEYQRDPNEDCHAFATEILNDKYGYGNWRRGPGSEYSKIVKACQRGGLR